jgi:auxin-responsive protein IAA
LVGWPPVKCAHRRSGGGGYVKVKMEGVAIGRKVHVSLHGSYDALLRTLDRMFPRPTFAANHGAEGDDEVAGRCDCRRFYNIFIIIATIRCFHHHCY